jgi:hypothetical protein
VNGSYRNRKNGERPIENGIAFSYVGLITSGTQRTPRRYVPPLRSGREKIPTNTGLTSGYKEPNDVELPAVLQ